MVGRTNDELRPARPSALEENVCNNLIRAAVTLTHCIEQLLKPSRLSLSQYNALEILDGAGPEGLASHQISERMTSHDPDMTRILDRLEARMLVSRTRDSSDRRVIHTRLTREGERLLTDLRPSVATVRGHLLRDLEKAKLRGLVEPLELIHENGAARSGSNQASRQ